MGSGVGGEESAGFPFGVMLEGEPAGVCGGISAFVVEPHGEAEFMGLVDGACEGEPLVVVLEVLVEGDIADDAAEALVVEGVEELVLVVGLVWPAVDDFEDAGIGWRGGEAGGPIVLGCLGESGEGGDEVDEGESCEAGGGNDGRIEGFREGGVKMRLRGVVAERDDVFCRGGHSLGWCCSGGGVEWVASCR